MKAAFDPPVSGRVLGTFGGEAPGPLLVALGGVHGNEPAGVHAIRLVLDELRELRPAVKGRFVGLAGNLAALRRGERFVDRDLNRLWLADEIARLASAGPDQDDAEQAELRELHGAIHAELSSPWTEVVILDLHSTSAAGSPFTIMGDTLQNRVFAFALPIPVILGLEERIEGTLLAHFGEKGHVALCIEGGQNEDEATVAHHVAALWLTLVRGGLVRPSDVPRLAEHRRRLAEAAEGIPRVVELRYRHGIREGEPFEMVPGYENFQRVERGEILAGAGPELERTIRTPSAGLLLMPRYQGRGDDGFFLGREVRRFWLHLSAALRRARAEWVLPLLPGVRRHPSERRVLLADPHVARWLVVELFHLFGYRLRSRAESALVFVRRPDDL